MCNNILYVQGEWLCTSYKYMKYTVDSYRQNVLLKIFPNSSVGWSTCLSRAELVVHPAPN